MPFQLIRNDITRVAVDAIVNTANPRPVVGGGTDAAIYRAAGEQKLLKARQAIGDIAPGEAVATPAFALAARHIIHTVGPVWVDGLHGERETLRACYTNSLALAAELGAESVAFPLIATGTYGFPKDEALNIALTEIGRFLLTHEMRVILVVFDRTSFALSGQLVGQIDEYISEHGVGLALRDEYAVHLQSERLRSQNLRRPEKAARHPNGSFPVDAAPMLTEDAACDMCAPLTAAHAREDEDASLDEMLDAAGETFQQRLFRLIDQRGMDDVTVYKKANIDRRVFSRIRSREDYRPKKSTAVAFAIALRLDMPEMNDLLARAEIALSPSSKFDLIITYFVTHRNYDIFEINAALFKYGQPILGE